MYNYKEEEPTPITRTCDAPGCTEGGEHRAPKTRGDAPDYYWFCLEHVRDYNKQWNYFTGMSQAEIEAFQKEAMLGHRPTWNHQMRGIPNERVLHEKLHGFMGGNTQADLSGNHLPPIRPRHRKALQQLELEHPAELKTIKRQYKKLVKQYHPDVNQGDRESEERFKRVSESYRLLIEEYIHA